MRVSDIHEIIKLSAPEKILLVEDLWDSIASDESAVPVPQSHKAQKIWIFPRNPFISCGTSDKNRELEDTP
jgi:hypothetical protein